MRDMRVVLTPRDVMLAAVELAARRLGVASTIRSFEPSVEYRPSDFPTLALVFVDGRDNFIDVRRVEDPERRRFRLGKTEQSDGEPSAAPPVEREVPF